MRFQWSQICKSRRIDVKAEHLRMLIGGVKCILKILEKGIALPTEVILDEGVTKTCPVEEGSRGDAD